jgi:hypothetical protein
MPIYLLTQSDISLTIYPSFVIRILGMAPGEMLHRAKGAFSLGGGNLAQTIKGGPPAIRHF